jgi:hypothetical protein
VAVVSTVVLALLGIAGTALTWFGLKKGFRTLLGRVQTRLELLLDEEQQGRLTPAPSLLDKLLK